MYNSIYPNINYHRYNFEQRQSSNFNTVKNPQVNNNEQQRQQQPAGQQAYPNGNRTAVDYTKGQINISQVLTDFKNTIIAISAPNEVRDEVYLYLNLVDRESKKQEPNRDIILANLKNASRISDTYIANSLNKPSNVVEGWIDALFLQKINLKSDPGEINPDFLLEFPKAAQEKIDANNSSQNQQTVESLPQEKPLITAGTEEPIDDETVDLAKIADEQEQLEVQEQTEDAPIQRQEIRYENLEVESSLELTEQSESVETPEIGFTPINVVDAKAKEIFSRVKQLPKTESGYTDALNMLNEALGLMENYNDVNGNIKAAIHLERGKIFDSYDYVDYALRDYFEATKADDLNLKANAFYKTGKIYDEFSEFSPALENYLSSVAYSGEADNYSGQTTVLSKIADLYAKQYDIEKCSDFSSLALDAAQETNDDALVANTHSNIAQNYQYLGENDKALDNYKDALVIFSRSDESYEQMAYNYEQASIVMGKLGNSLKAAKLQAKALRYYQLAQQSEVPQEAVS